MAAAMVALTRSSTITAGAHLLIGVGALVAVPVGVRLHRPRTATPWLLMEVACLAFLAGAWLRAPAIDPTAAQPLADVTAGVTDLFSGVGYLLLIISLWLMLRATGARSDGGAAADGALVMIAAALLSWALLIVPVLSGAQPQWDMGTRAVMASYPVADSVLLFLLTRIAFALRGRPAALWLMMYLLTCMLLGDIAYASVDIGLGVPLAVTDALYLLAFSGLAAAALHPTMSTLTAPQPQRTPPLRNGRLVAISVSMLIPVGLILTRPFERPADRTVLACGLTGIILMALWRTSQAVNGHARDVAASAHAAVHDSLTGLPNRTSLVRYTTQALARAGGDHAVAVVCTDLDGFKHVNESWGRLAGDELLVAFAARLRAVVGAGDFVARVSGDEFVVVCEGTDVAVRADRVAERILSVVADPFTLRAGRAHVTASVGLAHTQGRPRETVGEELIRDAAAALHRAKSQGRNRAVTFDRWMLESSADRIALQLALRDAVAADTIKVAYQPLVEIGSGRLLGFEALARWDRAGIGPVSPIEFIPVAEESGLIVPLGASVLSTAMAQLAHWRTSAPGHDGLHISVNVAARQLADPAFADLVAATLALHELPGDALWLEITESVIVDDDLETLQTLQRLDALGVTLAVDDFGTGYSSLSYLRRFPVGVLKIDRSFIAELGVDADADAIVAAVAAMARALGLSVVAEGVETTLQRDRLRTLGCDLAQGWLYGRPVDAEEASRVLAADLVTLT
ncbi:MAG TPA: bifunctional diguanylate cyclase/phosphodiesterase [Euzebya sp.]|nr:bifunctional diguanylate cyclase/phosphodiesterase [Euzebya sp.]